MEALSMSVPVTVPDTLEITKRGKFVVSMEQSWNGLWFAWIYPSWSLSPITSACCEPLHVEIHESKPITRQKAFNWIHKQELAKQVRMF